MYMKAGGHVKGKVGSEVLDGSVSNSRKIVEVREGHSGIERFVVFELMARLKTYNKPAVFKQGILIC
jgi:hypothetical protein